MVHEISIDIRRGCFFHSFVDVCRFPAAQNRPIRKTFSRSCNRCDSTDNSYIPSILDRRIAVIDAAALAPALAVRVNPVSPTPVYEQIRSQLAGMIWSRTLPTGSRLPSIRQLAGDLALATATVARAYSELEREGLVGGRGRRGTRVLPVPLDDDDLQRSQARLDHLATGYVAEVEELGVAKQQAVDAVLAAFERVGVQASRS
jgi:GntR family transcriptional regulator